MPDQGGEGVIVAMGGQSGGLRAVRAGRKLVHHYNWFDDQRYVISSSESMPAGKSTVRFDQTVAGRFGIDTFGVGVDSGSPVSNTYKPPFAFNGEIEKVQVKLK
jgi:hypothetical protein